MLVTSRTHVKFLCKENLTSCFFSLQYKTHGFCSTYPAVMFFSSLSVRPTCFQTLHHNCIATLARPNHTVSRLIQYKLLPYFLMFLVLCFPQPCQISSLFTFQPFPSHALHATTPSSPCSSLLQPLWLCFWCSTIQ